MQKFITLRSTAVLLPTNNIDTDQIIPARFLKTTSREEFGHNLFFDWRYKEDGDENGDFALNKMKGSILIAGDNFGCGSSREHAAWALYDYGFRAVISTSFADIFKSNALNNGLLPVQVSREFLQNTMSTVLQNPDSEITIDLTQSIVEIEGFSEHFPVNAYKRECLLAGLDDIDYLVQLQKHQQQ